MQTFIDGDVDFSGVFSLENGNGKLESIEKLEQELDKLKNGDIEGIGIGKIPKKDGTCVINGLVYDILFSCNVTNVLHLKLKK